MTTQVVSTKQSKVPIKKGVVVSNRMKKTIVVAVNTLKEHAKYKKRFLSTKKYKVHVPEGEYAIGTTVFFRECRPLSKEKRHIIVTKEQE